MSGVAITVRIEAAATRAAFNRLTLLMSDTTPVMRAIGVGLRRNVHDRFQSGVGPGGEAWAPLNPAYALGKRGPGILRESGMSGGLMGSIAMRAGRDQVELGTNKIYAAVHQFGATITPKQARHLRFWIGGRYVRASSVTIPARPYLGIDGEDERMIGETVTDALGRALGQGGGAGAPRR